MKWIASLTLLKPKHARCAALLLTFAAGGALADQAPAAKAQAPHGTYLNPLGDPPIRLQEPFVLPYSKKYFLFGTASPAEGFQCYESSDLAHWKLDGWAWRNTGLHVIRGELHAPQVLVYQDMFCLIYSGRTPTRTALGLAASTKPEGPYHDLHVPWLTLGDGCVAGDVFLDSNGKAYLTYTQASQRGGCNYRAIYGVALSKDLSKIVGEPIRLLEPSQRWELAQRSLNQVDEGSRLFKIGSRYFLTYSANDPRSSECAIGYATAAKPLGPWTKSVENPLLRTHSGLGVFGPSHGAAFRSLDRSEWFMVYDSLTDPTNHPEDRVINIDRLTVQENAKLAVAGPTRSPQPLPTGAR